MAYTDADWLRPQGLLGEIADWIEGGAPLPGARPLAVAAATVVIGAACSGVFEFPTNIFAATFGGDALNRDWAAQCARHFLHSAELLDEQSGQERSERTFCRLRTEFGLIRELRGRHIQAARDLCEEWQRQTVKPSQLSVFTTAAMEDLTSTISRQAIRGELFGRGTEAHPMPLAKHSVIDAIRSYPGPGDTKEESP